MTTSDQHRLLTHRLGWTHTQLDALPKGIMGLAGYGLSDPEEPGDPAGTREPRRPAPKSPPALLELAAA